MRRGFLHQWSFRGRISAGFAFTLVLLALISGASILALHSVIQSQDRLTEEYSHDLVTVEKLRSKAHEKVAIYRGFLLTRSWLYLEDAQVAENDFSDLMGELSLNATTEEDTRLLRLISQADHEHTLALGKAVQMRKRNVSVRKIARYFDETVMPDFDHLDLALNRFAHRKEKQLKRAREASHRAARRALSLIVLIAAFALLSAGTLASFLTRKLARLYGDAQNAVRAREDLMAVVSHDLGNFLTSIQMSSHLLFRKASQDEQGRLPVGLVETIQSSAQQMNRLIHDLLDLAKIQSGQFSITPSEDDARKRILESVHIMRVLAEKKGVKLESCLPVDDVQVQWDRNRISQVLANLITNAIKFTSSGGRIQVDLQNSEQDLLISVADTGSGIPEDLLPRIFDRYSQAQNTAHLGSGLGLHISKEIVEAHGGSIWVESRPGAGTTFFVSLPLQVSPSLDAMPGLTRELAHAQPGEMKAY